jgi:hypothetical protein
VRRESDDFQVLVSVVVPVYLEVAGDGVGRPDVDKAADWLGRKSGVSDLSA